MTQTIEYRDVLDKANWERGPWDHEVDKKQWQDEATGFPCLIVRQDRGFLCGYVGVPAGHPWHQRDYHHCDVDVHGGLTFAGACAHSPDSSVGICHVPEAGQPDDVWWLGFDCAHASDFSSMSDSWEFRERWGRDGVYRDQPYVERECACLARQIAAAQQVSA